MPDTYAGEYTNEPPAWYPGDDDDEPVFSDGTAAPVDRMPHCYDEPGEKVGDPFVVVWDDGSVSSKSEAWVSESFDMADCQDVDGVREILATDENGELVPVRVGDSQRINTDEEFPVRYANAQIFAGTRCVGHVTFTDH